MEEIWKPIAGYEGLYEVSEETKRKLSEAHKGISRPNPHKGYKWKVEGGKRVWYKPNEALC